MKRTEATYIVMVECDNCNFNDEIVLNVGTGVRNVDCPVCGLAELKKSDKIIPTY